jgi:hypothetical protein
MVLFPVLSNDPSVLPTTNNHLVPGEPVIFTRNATSTFPDFCAEVSIPSHHITHSLPTLDCELTFVNIQGGNADTVETLSVAGSDADFGLCGSPTAIAPVVYKPPMQGCTSVKLVLEDA